MNAQMYTLSKPQSRIIASQKRNRVVNAGRRFGKSWLAGVAMLTEATSEYAVKKGGAEIWYIAPTADQARRIMWKEWLKKYVPKQWIEYKNEVAMELVLTNGSRIQCFSGDDPDHLVGSGLDFLVMDEAALMSKDVYEKISPALSDKHHAGKAMFISTPRGYNWFHELFMNAEVMADEWESFQYTTIEGGNVREDEIEKKRRELSPKMFAQEFLASFETMANRIYDCYDREKNMVDYDPSWAEGDLHVGIDFNVSPMTATVSAVRRVNGREVSFTFSEFYDNNSNTHELCKWITRTFPKRRAVYAYPDPTGKKRQTSAAGVTDFDILESYGFRVEAPYAPYMERDKFNTANAALCSADGTRRAFIARGRCPHLCTGLDGYAYRDDGRPDRSGGHDHITDAFAYYLNKRFPISGPDRIYRPEVLGV